jgi:trehalose/maltose hydrolase-like predicted phosphorylase
VSDQYINIGQKLAPYVEAPIPAQYFSYIDDNVFTNLTATRQQLQAYNTLTIYNNVKAIDDNVFTYDSDVHYRPHLPDEITTLNFESGSSCTLIGNYPFY